MLTHLFLRQTSFFCVIFDCCLFHLPYPVAIMVTSLDGFKLDGGLCKSD